MSTQDERTELLRTLVGALVAGGLKIDKSERQKIDKELRERGKKRIDALFHAVITALVSYKPGYGPPRPLGRTHLEQLAGILAGMLNEYDETPRKAGRRKHDHRLIVIDFLLRKGATPNKALKQLHADIAVDWGTTGANVKKLITENNRSAAALLARIGAEQAGRTVWTAIRHLQRYRNSA